MRWRVDARVRRAGLSMRFRSDMRLTRVGLVHAMDIHAVLVLAVLHRVFERQNAAVRAAIVVSLRGRGESRGKLEINSGRRHHGLVELKK